MRRIRWTPEAAEDFAGVVRYIQADNEAAALETARAIYRRIQRLGRFPALGRPGREPGTRELVLAPLPYIVAYRSKDEAIDILSGFHGARRDPPC